MCRSRTSRPGRAKGRSQPQGRQAQRGKRRRVRRETDGRRSRFRVPPPSRRTETAGAWEEGRQRPGEGLESGHGSGYTETRKPVNGPTPSRLGSSAAITGRTVCGKSARTGLWGRRRVTPGATRRRGGGKRLGSCVGTGSCESEARVGREGFQVEPETLGLGTPPKGRNSNPLCQRCR